jgi:hypothetical protein
MFAKSSVWICAAMLLVSILAAYLTSADLQASSSAGSDREDRVGVTSQLTPVFAVRVLSA